MKKPKLSEVRALEQTFRDAHFSCDARIHVPHLLDLVERLGKALGFVLKWEEAMNANEVTRENSQRIYDASGQMIREARALLKELEL